MPDVSFHLAHLFLEPCDLSHQLLAHLIVDASLEINHADAKADADNDIDADTDAYDADDNDGDADPSHRLLLHLLNLIQVGFTRHLHIAHRTHFQ